MTRREQQTSRLEKISDFFGKRNFLRLNLYQMLLPVFVMSAIAVSGAVPVLEHVIEASKVRDQYQSLLQQGGTSVAQNPQQDALKVQKKGLVYPVLYRPEKTLNGNLADWESIPFQDAIDMPSGGAVVAIPEGLSPQFKACISDKALYLLLTAKDAQKCFEVSKPPYSNDSFEVFLDPLFTRGRNMDDTTSQTFILSNKAEDKIRCSGPLAMKALPVKLESGWGAEVEIPLKNGMFELTPFNGLSFGVNFSYNNQDNPKGKRSQNKLSWSLLDVADNSYQTPGVYGIFTVVMDKSAEVQKAKPGKEVAEKQKVRRSGETLPDFSILKDFRPNPAVTRGFTSARDTNAPGTEKWGANCVRVWVQLRGGKNYRKNLSAALDKLEDYLIAHQAHNQKVVITFNGIRDFGGQIWDYEADFLYVWQEIVKRIQPYKDVVWGLDLKNEPLDLKQLPYAPVEFHPMFIRVMKELRKIDKDVWFIYEVGPGGGWRGFEDLKPLPDPKVIYSFHFYQPGAFTHQGIEAKNLMDRGLMPKEQAGNLLRYPGVYFGSWIDGKELEKMVSPVIEFQKKYDVPIYVGEFSVVAWAPPESSAQYLKDCISIFEKYGWSWAYHGFNEDIMWQLDREDGVFNARRTYNGKRAEVIKNALKKNKEVNK